MTPTEHVPGTLDHGTLATVLHAVRSGSVGVSRLIWRVLSAIHEEHEVGTRWLPRP